MTTLQQVIEHETISKMVLETGMKVIANGHIGTLKTEYLPNMWEVRLDRGEIVLPASEIEVVQ